MDKPVLKGSKTEKNLMKAFTGESQARNRYTMFASIAKKEGYEQISSIFTQTADNEKEHAKIFYKFIKNNPIEFCVTMPHCLGNTYENLMCASQGEYDEWHDLYPNFADEADEEGFYEIAAAFRHVSLVEKHHDARFKKLAKNISEHLVFIKDSEIYWHCRNCGYTPLSSTAPEVCPVCHHPKAYFEVLCDNF